MNTPHDALALIFARNAFYRRLHYLAFAALTLTMVVIGLLIWVCYFLVKNPTHPLYFATDRIGRLIEITPVNQPNMTSDGIIAWATEAVQKTYSYDYVNYRSQLQSAERYFTTYGWSNYMKALKGSNNLLALTQRKQIVIAQVIDQPKIVAEGLLGGAYAWKLEMPLLVTYWEPLYTEQSKFLNALTATVIIQRQPILQSDRGLAILQLVANMVMAPVNQPQEISNTPTG